MVACVFLEGRMPSAVAGLGGPLLLSVPDGPPNQDPPDFCDAGAAMGKWPWADMGREKFTEPMLPCRSASCTSGSVILSLREEAAAELPARSTETPLLPRGVGDMMRWGGSVLAERRWLPLPLRLVGSDGTGGASTAGDIVPLARPGEGDRNVRSLMEPLLLFL